MKIDDGPLNRYLIKNLQPLTEADPSLLANYVAALLKNNKPKKELQKLCIDQLYDFLGDGTKSFVAKLFQSLEDGTVPPSAEEMETSKVIESGSAVTSGIEVVELRTSPPHLERLPSTAVRSFSDEGEDESSDDEDDDRNHKHRRRVSRSRSFDRDGEDEVDRGLYRKRGRATDNGQLLRENDHQGNERRGSGHALHTERDSLGKFDRRVGRDHVSGRFNAEGGQRGGLRSGPQFREGPGLRFDGPNGLMRGNMGRGRGIAGTWAPHDQRFPPTLFADGPEFVPPLLPPGPGAGFFPGRGMPGRSAPHTPWPGYGPLPGLGNGPLEHSHPRSGGIPGGRGPPISAGMGMTMNISMGRPRCLDFEERGYCLRGDLCPMEHGANRIVVEDVQSLSKFNLPVSLPSGRGLGIGPASGPASGPMLPPGLGLNNRNNHGSRETSLPAIGEDPALLNGAVPGNVGAEPDSYDPDQPLWNKDRSEASSGLRTLPSFQKGSHDQEWESDAVDKREKREGSESADTGRMVRLGGNTNGGSQISEGGPSVWDRIGPVVSVGSRLDAGLRSSTSVDLLHVGKQLRKDGGDEAVPRPRGAWQGKWNREVESEEESAPRGSSTAPSTHSRGWGTGRGDAGGGQRSGEGTSYGSRGTGGRSSSGFGTERAQRTLYVSFIPPNSNRTEQLLAHFQKFGDVLDIRIPAHSDRAFVQFARREDAESALTAPDAVMGNRFIRLSWANRDSIPDPSDTAVSTSGGRAVKSNSRTSTGSAVQVSKGSDKAAMNGSGSVQLELASVEAAVKPLSANGLSITPASAGGPVKKQEELERMRDEIRKKQDALAQKREDFRRKLDQLAKQGPVQGEASESEQPSKRQRLDDAEESASAPPKIIVSQPTPSSSAAIAPIELTPSSAALVKTNSGDALNKQTGASVMAQPPQPSPRSGRLPHARISSPSITYASPMTWGPARFKLDNRTTVFRVLPPFPAAVIDVGVLKDHFVMFGELATIEVDDAEGVKVEGSTKLSETNSVRVSFNTRRAAERAFVQGRWLQGQNLQLVWVNSQSTTIGSGGTAASTRADLSGEKPSLATPKYPLNTEQEGINGSRTLDREITGDGEEIQGMVADGNNLGQDPGVTGSTDKKKLSSTAQNLDWRRDTGLKVLVFSNSGHSSVSPSLPTESAVEGSLASESTGISNFSS